MEAIVLPLASSLTADDVDDVSETSTTKSESSDPPGMHQFESSSSSNVDHQDSNLRGQQADQGWQRKHSDPRSISPTPTMESTSTSSSATLVPSSTLPISSSYPIKSNISSSTSTLPVPHSTATSSTSQPSAHNSSSTYQPRPDTDFIRITFYITLTATIYYWRYGTLTQVFTTGLVCLLSAPER
jgi:hypothetical protein